MFPEFQPAFEHLNDHANQHVNMKKHHIKRSDYNERDNNKVNNEYKIFEHIASTINIFILYVDIQLRREHRKRAVIKSSIAEYHGSIGSEQI